MPKAIWKGAVLADSDDTEVVDNNHYFPPSSVKREHFRDSTTTTVCGWKGTASYYDIVVGDEDDSRVFCLLAKNSKVLFLVPCPDFCQFCCLSFIFVA